MNPIKFFFINWKIKKEKNKKKKRDKYFKKVNKTKKHYVCELRGCKNKLKGLTYKCPYCHKEFCEMHRLPEDHNCRDPRKPLEFKKGFGVKKPYEKSPIETESEREIN